VNHRAHNGVGDPVTLGIIAVLGIAALLGFTKPWKLFAKQPPVAELTQAQKDLDAAKARAAAAEKALADAQAAEREKQAEQVRYAQQMAHGTGVALASAPASPAVAVAQSLNVRTETGLTLAIGGLPAEQAKAIEDAVAAALAAKDHEIQTLNAALADKDAALKATTAERDGIKATIPALTAAQQAAADGATKALAALNAKADEVKAYAAAKAAEDAENSGLRGLAGGLKTTLAVAVVLLGLFLAHNFIVHFALPSLVAQFPKSPRLSAVYQALTSLSSAHSLSLPSVEPPKTQP